jgi:hypothetical protein
MVDLEHYKNTVCDDTWRVINEIAKEVKGRNLRLSFFNSTPQGGGGKLISNLKDNSCLDIYLPLYSYSCLNAPCPYTIFEIIGY